jgi:hypothetical protein
MGSQIQKMEIVLSQRFQLIWKDWLRAMIVASLSGAVFTILTAAAAGKLSGVNWAATGMMVVSTLATCLINKFFTQTGYVVNGNKNTVPILPMIVLIGILLTGVGVRGQSPFEPYPKVQAKVGGVMRRAIVMQDDSIVNAWRFGAQVAAFGYTFSKTAAESSQAMAGLEYGLKHMKWNATKQKWTILYSVNWVWWAINTQTPLASLSGLTISGPMIGFDNDLIQAGFFYNPSAPSGTNPVGIVLSLGIPLTN